MLVFQTVVSIMYWNTILNTIFITINTAITAIPERQ